MSLGRTIVALLAVTAGLTAVAVLSRSYPVAVATTLLAGVAFFGGFVGATFYVFSAFWAQDRDLARRRRAVLTRWLWVVAAGVAALFVWGILQALSNAG